MKLKGKQAFGPTGLFVIVNQFRGFDSVDVLSEMKAFGGDAVLVPLSLFHRFSDFSCIPELLSFLLQFSLFVQGQGGLVSAHRKNAPKGLAVANSRKTVSGFEIGLIPTDPPTVLLAGFEKTAVLNAAVPAFDLVLPATTAVAWRHGYHRAGGRDSADAWRGRDAALSNRGAWPSEGQQADP